MHAPLGLHVSRREKVVARLRKFSASSVHIRNVFSVNCYKDIIFKRVNTYIRNYFSVNCYKDVIYNSVNTYQYMEIT